MMKKDHINTECDYSFDDLYKAAFGLNLNKDQKHKLQSLSQEKINLLVKKWAKKAGWKIRTLKGSDGKSYSAFKPGRETK